MALVKRGNTYWADFYHRGKRFRQSLRTGEKGRAQQLHDKLKSELWSQCELGEKPKIRWLEAATRWLTENCHKKSIATDVFHLQWLKLHLGKYTIDEISRELLDVIINIKLSEGVSNATVNRMLEVIRAILRKAEREWLWLERAPVVRMLKEENRRIRWITPEEAERLLKALPTHLADLAEFSLHTGLRQSNVLKLEWSQVDAVKRHALIHPDQSKTQKAIPVPLNEVAIEVIRRQIGKHERFVFTYHGKPIKECNTKAWRKALQKSGIENFRWHDLRHTWASWHVQNGTSLQELQYLGGWTSFEMVLRYAHLSSDNLRLASEKIVTKKSQSEILKIIG
jgi:integrase